MSCKQDSLYMLIWSSCNPLLILPCRRLAVWSVRDSGRSVWIGAELLFAHEQRLGFLRSEKIFQKLHDVCDPIKLDL